MPTATATFPGFRPEAIQFLANLAANNDRAWFLLGDVATVTQPEEARVRRYNPRVTT